MDDRRQGGAGGDGRDEARHQRSLLEPVGIVAEKQKVCASVAGSEDKGEVETSLERRIGGFVLPVMVDCVTQTHSPSC